MDEERFVKQKAKVKWLAEGDANTKYFHNILKCKNNKKTILSVLGVDGMVLEGDLMIHEFVNFYEHFLGGEHDRPTLPSMDLFSKRLDVDMASRRLQLVRSVLSSMHIFWAAAFLLPVFTSKEMEAKLRKFLWGIKDDNKATAKVSWKKMEGGTGADAVQYFFSLECD
ncbi:hypothetical protein QVD17_30539 [Tagetes erecta]|uniref:RNA-directed DNA polymerase, eukaryota, reverse transcriptase zinc-binding domain protein n=1 Tax=Tagetes erecta TaxID=13708 RepID=A0AAD8NG31_TARER|nr:hypothetical protein QVD17_30539 [Tagetes erecta]